MFQLNQLLYLKMILMLTFQDIGQAYLENMGRPHSLNDDELEYLGKQNCRNNYIKVMLVKHMMKL